MRCLTHRIAGAIAVVLSIAPGLAHTEPYAAISAGTSVPRDASLSEGRELTFKPGIAVLGALGAPTRIAGLRAEVELGYRTVQTAELRASGAPTGSRDAALETTSLLMNAHYDIARVSGTRPFLTAGLGVARLRLEDDDASQESGVAAYQLGIGLSVPVSRRAYVDAAYRHFATASADLGEAAMRHSSHTFVLTLRSDF